MLDSVRLRTGLYLFVLHAGPNVGLGKLSLGVTWYVFKIFEVPGFGFSELVRISNNKSSKVA